jgi:hypothetical protein
MLSSILICCICMHACLQAALITPPVPAPARQEQLSKHSCTVPPASENHASSVRSVPFLSFPSQIHRLIGCESDERTTGRSYSVFLLFS